MKNLWRQPWIERWLCQRCSEASWSCPTSQQLSWNFGWYLFSFSLIFFSESILVIWLSLLDVWHLGNCPEILIDIYFVFHWYFSQNLFWQSLLDVRHLGNCPEIFIDIYFSKSLQTRWAIGITSISAFFFDDHNCDADHHEYDFSRLRKIW